MSTHLPEWVQRAQWRLMSAAPYAGQAIASARIIMDDNVKSNGVPTVASDAGFRVYVNPALESLPSAELGWILAHEILGHCVRGHCASTKALGLDPRMANIAQDLEIESWEWASLVRPASGLHPSQFGLPSGKLWRWYYERINQQQQCGHNGACHGDCGSAADGVRRPWELAEDDPSAPALRPEVQDAIRRATAEAAREYAAKHRGSVPAGLIVWADAQLEPPKVPWRRVLRTALDSELRRGMVDLCGSPKVHRTTGILRPSWAKPLPRVAIVADTSGSMTTAGGRVLGEIVGVVRQANAPVDICWCDVTPQWQYRVRSRHELRPRGGGGTDLRPAITAALEVRPKYDLIVVVTDGETPWPANPIPQAYIVTIGSNVPDGWRGVRVEV